jgi:hypothetical protein
VEFAVNYSPLLAELVREGQVGIDRFKCPAWPGLLAEARQTLPVYIHFPLIIGSGTGQVMDAETHAPADLERMAGLAETSGTYYLNTHWVADGRDYPGIAVDSRAPADGRRVVDGALRDLEPLIRRFGAERVLVENLIPEYGWLAHGVLPETLALLLEQSGCGLLLDLSHARLAARALGLDERGYVSSLPVGQVREVHITGLQKLEGRWLDLIGSHPGGFGGNQAGMWMDHLPMTEQDWPITAWAAGEIAAGRWNEPWVVGYEYGGVGGFWEAITWKETYLAELPRLSKLFPGRAKSPRARGRVSPAG